MAASTPSVKFHNGAEMPIVGLGTFKASSEEVGAALDAALEAGYRHIDTAYVYRNEAAVGRALKKWLGSGRVRREELFVVTKLPPFGNRAECVEKYLKKSLEALQLSYVDLYLIHAPMGFVEKEGVPLGQMELDMATDLLGTWKAMEAQVDAGRARSIGLSNFNARQIKRIVKAARIPPANLQVELHVYHQQRELVAFCRALDVTVCAYGPLGAPGNSDQAPSPLTDPVVAEVAQRHGRTPAQVLLRHVVQRGVVAIPKSANPGRIRENFQVFDFNLDEADLEKLDGLDRGPKGHVYSAFFREPSLVITKGAPCWAKEIHKCRGNKGDTGSRITCILASTRPHRAGVQSSLGDTPLWDLKVYQTPRVPIQRSLLAGWIATLYQTITNRRWKKNE